ncbi:DEAD/DEAH box helicase [Halanaerobiaceae bacterium Z-7014]|uniref:DEAD/DEAH box helicase n=1 Tax=Halonatronomonas betaini TaxID=2778430 RepID=A0A931F6R7_9FIRM|nr:DEAD/DEAH box helicase [Halonatronomonas betaini]MBF8437215.1 DEAD/DEAH box helicase [Halonatronomonas betaini]
MNLAQLSDKLKYLNEVTHYRELPGQEATYADFPEGLSDRLVDVLEKQWISRLYSHQAEAIEHIKKGRDTVVVTPTASGKTLCYNLPVLDSILKAEESRALYLFPTKALAQDQLNELLELSEELDAGVKTYTYDGDTRPAVRKSIRQAGHIVLTNPDMLHTGILPHHTKWVKLFENLDYVVIDEVHSYRGVFGSHVANVIRRLKRIAEFYGSDPVFITASATIANPAELASRLIGKDVELVDNNGAPQGPRDFFFYNPPIVNQELGIRKSYVLESKYLARRLLKNKISTIVFARTRLNTELLLSYLRDEISANSEIAGYRGGYLPDERRRIEEGLRDGSILGVISTNALELGIDIGQLEACLIAGYPGAVSSVWQQAGRAGRGQQRALTILVASSSPLDQFMINHPDYFFQQPPESGLINPNNLLILISHIKCAAFELPFEEGEIFGVESTAEILDYLVEERVLHFRNGRWYWMTDKYPAQDISLRSASSDDFAVIDMTANKNQVIGKVDYFAAPTTIHEKAIYIHGGDQYQVQELDFEDRRALVKKVDVNYYTDASLAVELKVLEDFERQGAGEKIYGHGEVSVTARATMFKKVKFNSHENVGYGDINLPEQEMHTTAYWLTAPADLKEKLGQNKLENGLIGIANLIENIAPLFLLADSRDLKNTVQIKSPFTGLPTIFFYDSYPGGIGLSEKLFRVHEKLLDRAHELLTDCPCEQGCPSCVGPGSEVGLTAKEDADLILTILKRGDNYESKGKIKEDARSEKGADR